MPNDDITLVSTTDSPEDVQAALTGRPAEPAQPVAEPAKAAEPAKPEEVPAAAAAADPVKSVDTPVETKTETAVERAERESKSARERRMERIQGDIDSLIAKRGTTRRDVEAEEARLAELRAEGDRLRADIAAAKAGKPTTSAEPAKPAAAVVTTEPFATPRPKLDDVDASGKPRFASYEEWVEAGEEWVAAKIAHDTAAQISTIETKIRRELTETEKARATTEAARADQARAGASYQEKVAVFAKTTPDFEQVLKAAADSVIELKEELGANALHIIDTYTVRDAENGPAIVHHLAQHPEEMRRIASLAPPLQLAALGRLDERLARASTPEPARVPVAPVTKAPEPITPVRSAPTASTVSPEDEDYAAYKRRRDLEDPQTRDWARKIYGVTA